MPSASIIITRSFEEETNRSKSGSGKSLKEGLSIFSPSNIVPFTVAQNQNSVHLGYTREFNHKVATNSLGFRGVKEIEKQKPEGTYRILVIGDSMTFGWGVEDNETFSSILERNLNAAVAEIGAKNKFEVINAGFSGGFTLDGFYSWLVNKGFELNPDLVLVSFFPYNDVSDLLEMEWSAPIFQDTKITKYLILLLQIPLAASSQLMNEASFCCKQPQ